jgi:hypothetical protein
MHKYGLSLLVGACAGLMLAAVPPAYAAAGSSLTARPACDPEGSRSDLDGDGASDTVVGMPSYDSESGGVDIRGTSSPAVVLTAEMLGGRPGEGAGLGAAIVLGDLDADGCGDLVVSAPNQNKTTRPGRNGGGQVYIVFGGVGGLNTADAITLPHGSIDSTDFGAALALERRDVGDTVVHDLYVGAPGTTVSGRSGAGAVFHYTLTADPAKRVVATLRNARHQDSPGVPGVSEQGDGFGSVLTATRQGVLVGTPGEDVGARLDAGAVWFLKIDRNGAPAAVQSWSQDSPGVPGAAETGDHFGASMSSSGNVAVIGVPDEDHGEKTDSGAVLVLDWNRNTGTFGPGRAISQGSVGIPGAIEAGDRFGAAVAVGSALQCREAVDAAIGAPGEDVGEHPDVGTITLVTIVPNDDCPSTVVRQGAGLAGEAEAGDQVGSVLGIVSDRPDLEENPDRLLIGVPLEDVGTACNAGIVQPLRGGLVADGVLYPSLTFSQGPLKTTGYGEVLSNTAA